MLVNFCTLPQAPETPGSVAVPEWTSVEIDDLRSYAAEFGQHRSGQHALDQLNLGHPLLLRGNHIFQYLLLRCDPEAPKSARYSAWYPAREGDTWTLSRNTYDAPEALRDAIDLLKLSPWVHEAKAKVDRVAELLVPHGFKSYVKWSGPLELTGTIRCKGKAVLEPDICTYQDARYRLRGLYEADRTRILGHYHGGPEPEAVVRWVLEQLAQKADRIVGEPLTWAQPKPQAGDHGWWNRKGYLDAARVLKVVAVGEDGRLHDGIAKPGADTWFMMEWAYKLGSATVVTDGERFYPAQVTTGRYVGVLLEAFPQDELKRVTLDLDDKALVVEAIQHWLRGAT